MSFRRIERFGRRLVTCALVPLLLTSSLTTHAILIHDHHGHDTHSHALGVHDLDEVRSNPEHEHAEHEHDSPTVDPADSKSSSLVIHLDLPEGIVRGRLVSISSATVAGSHPAPSTNAVAIFSNQFDRSYVVRQSSLVLPMRARGVLEGILLTSHALLL